ncbi:SURF1 family protein [Taklimakanibacter lacteus]|uniref:SURF1 family protein n=1 Tax=Taklimakanibacter lacteus TaxID=2268456 RepID=UPI000E664506
MSGRVWQILLAAILGVAVLVGLGVWQLQRLAWKEALIAERDLRVAAAPVPLDQALKEFDADHSVEFLKVETDGIFQHKAEAFMLTTEGGVPGFEVVTPLASADGIVVLVDRGFVPEPLKDPAKRPDSQPPGEVQVNGIVRRHVGGRGPFTPDNDPDGNIWYWWDIPAMLAYADVAPDARVAPFVLHVQPGAGAKTLPAPVTVDSSLTNNHLQYALTWFSLAAVLVVMAGFLIRQTVRKDAA